MLVDNIESGDGRSFSLREVGPGEMLDLIEAGGDAASFGPWMRYALLICSVCAIDAKPIPFPTTKNSIRDLGKRIGNVGMDALARVHYPEESSADGISSTTATSAKN